MTRPHLLLALSHLYETEARPNLSRNRGDPAHDCLPSKRESAHLFGLAHQAASMARRELAREVADWFSSVPEEVRP